MLGAQPWPFTTGAPGEQVQEPLVWTISTDDFKVVVRRPNGKPGQFGSKGGPFHMSSDELAFVELAFDKLSDFTVVRIRGGKGAGDFLLQDRQSPGRGYLVEVKKDQPLYIGGGGAGFQFANAQEALDLWGIKTPKKEALLAGDKQVIIDHVAR
jgi:hypothetical protein